MADPSLRMGINCSLLNNVVSFGKENVGRKPFRDYLIC